MRPGWMAAALLVVVPAVSPAQSLGEVARKAKQEKEEKEKRGKGKPAARVYDNEDLDKHTEEVNWDPAAGLGPQPERRGLAADSKGRLDEQGRPVNPDGPAGIGAEQTRDDRKRQWQVRAAELQRRMQGAEASVKAAEARVGEIGARTLQSTDSNEILRLQAERQAAEAQLTEAKAELEAARQEQTLLEDDARREGVPPGWVRSP